MYQRFLIFIVVVAHLAIEGLLEPGSVVHSGCLVIANCVVYLGVLILLRWHRVMKSREMNLSKISNQTPRAIRSKLVEEKLILSEILSLCSTVRSESDLISKLASFVDVPNINIIHMATIFHRLAQVNLIRKCETLFPAEFARLIETAKRLVTNESAEGGEPKNSKTCLSLIVTVSRILKANDPEWNKTVNRFCSIDSVLACSSSLVQILTSLPLQLVSQEVLLTAQNKLLSLPRDDVPTVVFSQTDLVHSMQRLCNLELILLVSKFGPKNMNAILSAIQRKWRGSKNVVYLSHISNHLDPLLEGVSACSPQDLVACFSVCPDSIKPRMHAALVDSFFQLPIHFIKDHVMGIFQTGKETNFNFHRIFSQYLKNDVNFDRIRLGVSCLLATQTVPPHDLLESILIKVQNASLTSDTANLLALLGHIDDRFSDFFKSKLLNLEKSDPQIRSAALTLNLPSAELTCLDNCVVMRIPISELVILAALCKDGTPAKKQVLNRIYHQRLMDRFVATTPLEALCALKLNPCKNTIEKAIRILQETQYSLEAVSVALAMLSGKRRFVHHINEFLLKQIPACSLSILAHMVRENALRPHAIAELSKRLHDGRVSLPSVTLIVDYFTASDVESSEFDHFFKALQDWLVPQIPKLTLDQVALIANALEMFEKRNRSRADANEIDTP